jgi:hypothetical protein
MIRGTGLLSTAAFLLQRGLGFVELPSAPDFDDDTLEEFVAQLRKAKLYLEFGAGGSTTLASELEVPTVSVESDAHFAKALTRALDSHASVKIVHADIGATGTWGWPLFTRLTPARLAKWKGYSLAPWKLLPTSSFPDFILVDGRFRRACALETARRAAMGGHDAVLMFDDYFNEGRTYYHSVSRFLGPSRRVGRAAFFDIGTHAAAAIPTDRDILEANADPR